MTSNAELLQRDHRALVHSLHNPAAHLAGNLWVRGEGCDLIDADGKRYIDAMSGLWNVTLGHGRRELADAVARQMGELAYASGYSGNAAEKKLEQTKQNLLRISDIVAELDKRMGTLRRQAQKAERYRSYKQELRDLDLWKASHRYLELRTDAAAVNERLTEATANRESVRADFDVKDSAVIAERAELALEERRIATLQEQLYELDNGVRLAESKIGFQTREAGELDEGAVEQAAERERLVAQRADAGVELAARQAELEGLAAEVAAGEAAVTAAAEAATATKQELAGRSRASTAPAA